MRFTDIIFIGIAILLSACGSSELKRDDNKTLYRSINKDDTASLNVVLTDKEFYGQYEINYHSQYKDSGDVNGIVKGDTLKGTFHYQQYGNSKWYRIPISLLKKDDQLIMGTGEMVIYMNMTFFKKNIPIDYQNPKFIFKKMD